MIPTRYEEIKEMKFSDVLYYLFLCITLVCSAACIFSTNISCATDSKLDTCSMNQFSAIFHSQRHVVGSFSIGFLICTFFLVGFLSHNRKLQTTYKKKYEQELGELQQKVIDITNEAAKIDQLDRILYNVLENERSLSMKLLHTMVPPKIAHDLSHGIAVPPEMFAFVVIFFSDIVGFTTFASSHTPLQVFDMLDGLFSVMDHCTTQFPSLYKVETIGDAVRRCCINSLSPMRRPTPASYAPQ